MLRYDAPNFRSSPTSKPRSHSSTSILLRPTEVSLELATEQPRSRLLLLGLLRVGLVLGSLRPHADESGLASRDSEFAESTLLALGEVALLDLGDTVLDADTALDGES